MRSHLVRAFIAVFVLSVLVVPAEAQRRGRDRSRDGGWANRGVEVDVRLRSGRPSVRLIAYDRWYYRSPARHQLSLRRLARVSHHAFRRALRDHRALHRHMRHLRHRRAKRMHRQWHRQKGWSHREFVELWRR